MALSLTVLQPAWMVGLPAPGVGLLAQPRIDEVGE